MSTSLLIYLTGSTALIIYFLSFMAIRWQHWREGFISSLFINLSVYSIPIFIMFIYPALILFIIGLLLCFHSSIVLINSLLGEISPFDTLASSYISFVYFLQNYLANYIQNLKQMILTDLGVLITAYFFTLFLSLGILAVGIKISRIYPKTIAWKLQSKKSASIDLDEAIILCKLSKYSYHDQQYIASNFSTDFPNWKILKNGFISSNTNQKVREHSFWSSIIALKEKILRSDTFGFVACNQKDKALVLVFRGTKGLRD